MQTIIIFNTCWNDNKKHTTTQCHKTQEVLMHGHVVMLMHDTPLHPYVMCV